MPLPDLLLGTRRLRREIAAQSQQLEYDIAHVKQNTAAVRTTAVARMTSPLGLATAVGLGFIAGKLSGRPQQSARIARQTVNNIATQTLDTLRALGIQVLMPMAIAWVQTKLASNNATDQNNNQ